MAINLVHTVSRFLTPEVVARFANAIGVNPTLAQTLVNAALPTILASFGGVASTPAGAQRLSDHIGAQDPGLLDNLAATFAGGQSGLASSGSSLLSSLLGGAGVSSVAGALSRLTGAQSAQAESALGMLTPVALSAIGRQDPSLWSNAQSLGSLFAGQRDVIQQAMPAGLGAALGGLGLPALSGVASPAREAAATVAAGAERAAQATGAAVGDAARETAEAGRAVARDAERAVASGTPSWVMPALAIAVLALAGWWFLGRTPAPAPAPAPKPAASAPAAPAPAAPAPVQQVAPAPAAGNVDVAGTASNVATATVASLQQVLAGVTDAASARAAEGKLKEAAAQVDKAAGAISALPEAARKTVASQAKPAVSKLQEQVAKVLAIAGVGEILKPILDPMMAKLNAIAGA